VISDVNQLQGLGYFLLLAGAFGLLVLADRAPKDRPLVLPGLAPGNDYRVITTTHDRLRIRRSCGALRCILQDETAYHDESGELVVEPIGPPHVVPRTARVYVTARGFELSPPEVEAHGAPWILALAGGVFVLLYLLGLVSAGNARSRLARYRDARPCVVDPAGHVVFTDGHSPSRGVAEGIAAGPALAYAVAPRSPSTYREDALARYHAEPGELRDQLADAGAQLVAGRYLSWAASAGVALAALLA